MKIKSKEVKEVLYIKLGKGGEWEEQCITNGTLRIGFKNDSHERCLGGDWDTIREARVKRGKNPGPATHSKNQIQLFYESDEKVLWVTFWKGSLYWCFAKPQVIQLRNMKNKEDNDTKIRHVLKPWSNRDVNGNPLWMSRLSGKLLAKQAFRGTISPIKEGDMEYLVDKINGIEPPHAEIAKKALADLEQKLEVVIKSLDPKDFEILIDLIFRQMGFRRVSVLGEQMKDLDLVLRSPMDEELYGVQVKSHASLATFRRFKDEQVKAMDGFTRFCFAVHTPDPDLAKVTDTSQMKLLLPARIAHLSVQYGLAQWVIDKAR